MSDDKRSLLEIMPQHYLSSACTGTCCYCHYYCVNHDSKQSCLWLLGVYVCVCILQLASEQAQSLEGATAAEERIQALEQRLASEQHATTAQQAAAAGEPPAMAAPGN